MTRSQFVLEILKLVLSPQVVVGVCVLAFVLWFRSEVRALMSRIARIRLGAAEFDTPQAQRLERSDVAPPAQLTLSLASGGEKPEDASDAATLRLRLDTERARAALWEYRYLNYFLARATQVVLDWLASLQVRTTKSMYDSYWLPLIASADEREAIMIALQAHHLIQIKDDVIEVTPKGREYITWRGPLPKNA
jgi:hypothetical protein